MIRSNLFRSPKRIPCCCKSLPGTVCIVCHCLPCDRVLPSSNQCPMVLGICPLFKASSCLCVSESCIVRECYKSYIAPVGVVIKCLSVDLTQLIHSSKKKNLSGFTIIRSLVILALCDLAHRRPASRQIFSNSMHLIHEDECCIYPIMQESTTN